MSKLRIVPAAEEDVPVILELILALAEYERLTDSVTATKEQLRETLFGSKPAAEGACPRLSSARLKTQRRGG